MSAKTIRDLPEHSRPREKLQEHFLCISLNGANEVIQKRVVTIGLLDQSPDHPREVLADVIVDRAAAVILVHNHPSGDPQPSKVDFRLQARLTEAARILGICVLDHIIVSRKAYYSFQEGGEWAPFGHRPASR